MHYVYKYVYNGEIIYIGKADHGLEKRLYQHGRKGDNIPEKAWDEINASEIFYIKLPNKTMTDVVESELIRRYQPKYCISKKSDWCGIPFMEPEWVKYEENNIPAGSRQTYSQTYAKITKTSLKKQIKSHYSAWMMLNTLQKTGQKTMKK